MSRCRMLKHVPWLVLVCAMLAGGRQVQGQIGSTTDVIVGRVVGPDSAPLRAAHVNVTSIESGITRRQVTGDDGRYSVVFPDGGGRYVLTVQYLGMAPVRAMVQRRADEDRLVANFALVPTAVRLSAVNVEAQRIADSLGAGAGAVGRVLSRELLEQLGYQGNEAAALAMMTPGVTLTKGDDSSFSSISINGQSASQTAHLIDGLAAGRASLPSEAVKSTNVVTSAFDVANGGFTGGFVQQTTVSGTNKFDGSLNTSTPLGPLGFGSTQPGVLRQTQKGYRGGGSFAGPFIRDHLFGSFAFNVASTSMPQVSLYTISPASLTRLGVDPDSVARFLDILGSRGLTKPASGLNSTGDFSNRSLFGRIDFTPSERHTLTASANQYYFTNRGFTGSLGTPTASSGFEDEFTRASVSLTSHLGAWVNDARSSYSAGHYGAVSNAAISAGSVVLPSTLSTSVPGGGISTLSFGGTPYSSQLTKEWTVDAKDELSWLSGDGTHRVKLGGSVSIDNTRGGGPGNLFGSYRFNSLTDLENGVPASYTRTLAPAIHAAKSSDVALYIGDAWRTGPALQLVYGLRLERSVFYDSPQLNSAAQAAFGIRTDVFPSETRLSPRLGFTYGVGATDKKPASVTIRGGVGMFRSSADQISTLFSSARDATGLANSQANLSCVGAAVPPLDWASFSASSASLPTQCAGGVPSEAIAALPRVLVVDPSFQLPRTLQASLSADRSFAKIWNLSLSASLTSGYAGTAYQDLNLVAAPRFTLADESNRPVYVAPSAIVPGTGAMSLGDSRVNPAFGNVTVASSYLHSSNRSASLSIGRMTPKLNLNASYQYTDSRTQVVGTANDGLYSFGSTVAGDPRAVQWVRTPWASPHSLRFFVTYNPNAWLSVSPSIFAQSGRFFDPQVSADMNGDGTANDRAFIFDPAHTADTAVANGMTRLLAAAPANMRHCLQSQLGHIAGTGSCQAPWFAFGSLSIRVKPPWDGGRLSISLQTNNLPAGLDMLLHGSGRLHGWGQYPSVNTTLLYVRGFDPASQTFRYAVNQRFGASTQQQSLYLQPMQLSLVARISLGAMGGAGGPGGPAPSGAFTGTSAGAVPKSSHADSLRTKIAATMPNVFRRTLALADSLSLGLDSVQKRKLTTLGGEYQAHADSLVNTMVSAMAEPVAGADPAVLAASLRAKTDQANALQKQAVADLRAVLREEQFRKLPSTLVDMK